MKAKFIKILLTVVLCFFAADPLLAQERVEGEYKLIIGGYVTVKRSVYYGCNEVRLTTIQRSNTANGLPNVNRQFYTDGDIDTDWQKPVNDTTIYKYSQRVIQFYAWAGLADKKTIGKGCRDRDEYQRTTTLDDAIYEKCTTQSLTNVFNDDGKMYGSLTVKASPVMDGVLKQYVDNLIPVEDQITFYGPKNFPSAIYNWQYSFDLSTWTNTAVGQGQDVFKASAKQLLGAKWNDTCAGKQIYLRLMSPCGTVSNWVFYNIRFESPHIIGQSGTDPLCADETNGSITLRFDRPLLTGESLNILIEDTKRRRPYDGVYGVVLNANNEATIPNLGDGYFKISLSGTYKDPTNATYVGSIKHTTLDTLTEPKTVQFSATGKKDVYCYGGSDGTIQLSAFDGKGNFRVFWKLQGMPDFASALFSSANSHTLSNLPAGTYLIMVKDINGCTERLQDGSEKILEVQITQPGAALSADEPVKTEPKAFGYEDGSIALNIMGGTPLTGGGYTVTLKNAAGAAVPFTAVVLGTNYHITADNLKAGTYTLTATDKNTLLATGNNGTGCKLTLNITLSEPPLLTVSAEVTDSISCYGRNDGTLKLTAAGGVPFGNGAPYRYAWYNVANGIYTTTGQTGTIATELPAGDYVVRVTDANTITRESGIIHLVQPDELRITMTTRNVSCYNGADGKLTPLVSGGTPAFAYQWSNNATSSAIAGLSAGDYILKVTDNHGCIANAYPEVTMPAAPLGIATQTTTLPAAYGYTDGSVRVILNGGTPLAAGAYNITWTNESGAVMTTAVNRTVTGGYETYLPNIGAGKYKLVVTDALYVPGGAATDIQSCRLEQEFMLTEPPLLEVSISMQHIVSCYGFTNGSLLATAQGGVPFSGADPYRYQWYKVVNGTATVMPQQTATAVTLGAGIYQVKVTDFNNIERYSPTFELTEPLAMTLQLSTRAVTCFDGDDGFVKTTTAGGTLPYTYMWSNATNDKDVLDVRSGEYTTTVTDLNGCYITGTGVVAQPVAPLAVVTETHRDPMAFGYTDGYITIVVNGGTAKADGSYTVVWTNEQNQQLTSALTKTSNGYQTTLSGIGQGVYTLLVTDAKLADNTNSSTEGCRLSAQYTLDEPPLLTADIEEIHYISCLGDSDGVLTAHAKGGIPAVSGLPYQYQWYRVVNGTTILLTATDSVQRNLPTGDYLVKVTDQNNVTRSSPIYHLATPALLTVGIQTTPVTCASGEDGTATAVPGGGTVPYTYQWTTGDTAQYITGVTAGNLFVFVTDAHGCEAQEKAAMFVPGGIETDPLVKAPTCNNYRDGSIVLNASGGTPPFTYLWEDGSTADVRYDLGAGNYSVVITDAGNCRRVQRFTLTNPPLLSVSLGQDKTLCNGQTLTLNATINDSNAQYVWTSDNGFKASTAIVTLDNSGKYEVRVVDSKGCSGTGEITVEKIDTDISADFVVSTQVFSNEDVYVFNISDPAPEAVEWIVPAGVTIVDQTQTYAQLRFADSGVYIIGMRAMIGACDMVYSKSINVFQKENFIQPGGAETPFIKTFEVSPNPNGGQFTVHITLDKASPVRLRMVNIISNQLVSDRKEAESNTFNISYGVKVPSGIYLLSLETPLGNMIRKIVINQ